MLLCFRVSLKHPLPRLLPNPSSTAELVGAIARASERLRCYLSPEFFCEGLTGCSLHRAARAPRCPATGTAPAPAAARLAAPPRHPPRLTLRDLQPGNGILSKTCSWKREGSKAASTQELLHFISTLFWWFCSQLHITHGWAPGGLGGEGLQQVLLSPPPSGERKQRSESRVPRAAPR